MRPIADGSDFCTSTWYEESLTFDIRELSDLEHKAPSSLIIIHSARGVDEKGAPRAQEFRSEAGRHARRSVTHKKNKSQRRKQKIKDKKRAGWWVVLGEEDESLPGSPCSDRVDPSSVAPRTPPEGPPEEEEEEEEASANEREADSGGAAGSSTDRWATTDSEEKWFHAAEMHQQEDDKPDEVWANCEWTQVLLPRFSRRFTYAEGAEVGEHLASDDRVIPRNDAPTDPLCRWCFFANSNANQLPHCKNCGRVDPEDLRFTGGRLEDEGSDDEPPPRRNCGRLRAPAVPARSQFDSPPQQFGPCHHEALA